MEAAGGWFAGDICFPEPGGLPILIKLIDAKKDLSVQVHPDDAYALSHENGQRGKNEMWYVLDAAKDAALLYGFHHAVDREKLRRSIERGSIEKHLLRVPVKKDDVFYIPAGKVHAIGAGALIAEIQESSNLTYRLYDYGRVERDGKKRELHIDKALDVFATKQVLIQFAYDAAHMSYEGGQWVSPCGDPYKDGVFVDRDTGKQYFSYYSPVWELLLDDGAATRESGRA